MKLRGTFFRLVALSLLGCTAAGCVTSKPKGIALSSEPDRIRADRQLQTRIYRTAHEAQILSAAAALFQDSGFALGENDTDLGMVTAYKVRNIFSAQDELGKMGKNALKYYSIVLIPDMEPLDFYMHLDANLVTQPLADNRIKVRVVFQRVILNLEKKINRVDRIDEPAVYQEFFSKLSKSIFLEDQGL